MTTLPRFRLAALALCLPLLPGAALAAAATASQNLNVRSGPATSYGVVTQLPQGTAVDVRQCEGDFCQIIAGTTTGWVSATYLTRDAVKPAAPTSTTIASTKPTTGPATSSVTITSTTTKPAPLALPPPAQIATVRPTPRVPALPPGTFPPAYDGSSDQAAATDESEAQSSVNLNDDNGDTIIASTDPNIPRPKADVPNGSRSGPDDEFADNSDTTPPADIPDNQPAYAPRDDWRYGPGFGRRLHRFGGDGARPLVIGDHIGRVCFFEAPGAGDGGFCVREGQTVADLGDWSDQLVAIRNPEGLRVTVCMDGGPRDCRVFDQSGPLDLPGTYPIGSIRVDAPRD